MKKFIISIAVLAFASVMAVSTVPAHANGACTVTSFTASPSTVSYGGSATVTWTSSGCDTVSITPAQNPGNRPPSGSVSTGPLIQTTTFTVTGYTNYGTIGSSQSVTITVSGGSGSGGGGTNGGACQPTSFTAQEYTLQSGEGTVLHWDSQNCDSTSIVPADYPGDRPPYGSVSTGAIFKSTEYTLTVYDANGNIGGQRFLTINVTGSGGGGNNNYCQINNFTANPSSITQGAYSTLQWNTSGNVSYVTINGLSGNQSANGSVTVSPYSTTTYNLTAYCNGGNNQTSSTTVYVNNGGGYYGSAPQAITTVATVLDGNAARLNGLAIPNTSYYSNTNAWFEWGIGTSLVNRTPSQMIASNGSQPYSTLIAGLVPGATYSYRAVVQNAGGIAYGSIVTFRTTTPLPQVPVQTVTTTTTTAHTVVVAQSAPSSLKLSVDTSSDRMCINGEIDYTITYQNISKQPLKKAVLQFTLPKEVTFMQSSGGGYSIEDRTITIPLDDIAAGEQGVITVRGQVNTTAAMGNLTVATATIVYTNAKTHAQEDAIAYAMITVTNVCPVMGGVGYGSFLPTTLVGWLLLILVIFALVVLGRQLAAKKKA